MSGFLLGFSQALLTLGLAPPTVPGLGKGPVVCLLFRCSVNKHLLFFGIVYITLLLQSTGGAPGRWSGELTLPSRDGDMCFQWPEEEVGRGVQEEAGILESEFLFHLCRGFAM